MIRVKFKTIKGRIVVANLANITISHTPKSEFITDIYWVDVAGSLENEISEATFNRLAKIDPSDYRLLEDYGTTYPVFLPEAGLIDLTHVDDAKEEQ